jgi:hypothetical protein
VKEDKRMSRFAGYSLAVLGVLALLGFPAREARAAVSVVPSQVVASSGQTKTITIQYRFSGLVDGASLPYGGIEESFTGTFLGPTRSALQIVSTLVTTNVVNGSGVITESLTIPASLIDNAIRSGYQQILYERAWVGAANSPTSQVSILVASSEAVGPLRIRRIELYFGNRRGETTVNRNQRGLKAFGDIRYAGTGVLTGYWEVDGRRILDVNRQLTFGTNVTLSTPEVPDLPTFDTGAHIVRLVLTNPPPAGPLPQLLYYVTAAKELRTIRIPVTEGTEGSGKSAMHSFSWEKPEGMDLFFLEFSEEQDGKPIFSAFTREASYKLPGNGLAGLFTPGKTYFWRVKGYDASDDQVGASESASFRF